MAAVDANRFVERFPCNAELLGPISNVGAELRVDLIWIMGTLAGWTVVVVQGVGLSSFGLFRFVVFVRTCRIRVGHACILFLPWLFIVMPLSAAAVREQSSVPRGGAMPISPLAGIEETSKRVSLKRPLLHARIHFR